MVGMTGEMQDLFDKMDDQQKIRMFYELAKYIGENAEDDSLDNDMKNLFNDIANVVNDIENL